MLQQAIAPQGPVHHSLTTDFSSVVAEANEIHRLITIASSHSSTLVSSAKLIVDECWPSAKSRIEAKERRDREIAQITPTLTRLHSLDATKTRLVTSLQAAVEVDDTYQQHQINRSLSENKSQISSTLEDIYQNYEGLSAGTTRSKHIALDLSSYINAHIDFDSIDGIAVLDAIVKHVADHIGDFPTIYPDVKLMWADFDPHDGTFWVPTPPEFDDPRRSRYMSESTLFHSRLATALGADIMDRIVEVGLSYGRSNTKTIVVPRDNKDGITLFRGAQALFFDSKEKTIVQVEESIASIAKLFFTGFPGDTVAAKCAYEKLLKRGERYGVRVKWSQSGRGIIRILTRRNMMFGQLIDADEQWVTGGDYADDSIPLLRKLATKIKRLCETDAYRREMWHLELGADEGSTILVNSSIASTLDSLRTIDTRETKESPAKRFRTSPPESNPTTFSRDDVGYHYPCARRDCTSGRMAPREGGYCNPCHYAYAQPHYKGKGAKGYPKGGRSSPKGKGKGKSKGKGKGKGGRGGRGKGIHAYATEVEQTEVEYKGYEGYEYGQYGEGYEGYGEGYEGYEGYAEEEKPTDPPETTPAPEPETDPIDDEKALHAHFLNTTTQSSPSKPPPPPPPATSTTTSSGPSSTTTYTPTTTYPSYYPTYYDPSYDWSGYYY